MDELRAMYTEELQMTGEYTEAAIEVMVAALLALETMTKEEILNRLQQE